MKVIYNVQILRFIASLMVLMSHAQHEVTSRAMFHSTGFRPFAPVYWNGGVDIFFVVSGFIMYQIGIGSFGRKGGASDFIVRRLIRVGPPYWFFTAALLLAILIIPHQLAHSEISLSHIVGSFFFFPVKNPYGDFYPVLILGWTLNFELMFYTIYAVSLNFSRRLGLALIVLVLWTIGLVGFVAKPTSAPFAFWCDPIVIEFTFGMAIAAARSSGFRWSPLIGVLVSLIGLGAMIVLKQADIAENNWLYRPLWMGIPAALIGMGFVFVEEREPGRIKRWLAKGGDISFALYLSHPFSIGVAAVLFEYAHLQSPWLYITFTSLAAIAGAAIVYRCLERPLLRVLLAFNQKWRPQPAVSAVS